MRQIGNATIYQGAALAVLRGLPSESVHCVVTSPPYYGLRSYLADGHEDKGQEIGLEPTPDAFIAELVAVFREVRRVLRDDGTLWLNIGDSYAMSTKGSSGKGEKQLTNAGTQIEDRRWRIPTGVKAKDLIGIPWMLAFALRADGWYLRQEIIWHKPNPMPESVTDRCTKAHESLFLLSKRPTYYYDAAAIKEPSVRPGDVQTFGGEKARSGIIDENDPRFRNGSEQWGRVLTCGETRNKRSVWTVPTQPYSGAHFATFPPEIPRCCIRASTSERGACPQCGCQWRRIGKGNINRTIGWEPTCKCGISETVAPLVLDPFSGAGTTALVACQLGRRAIGIELSAEYVALSEKRIEQGAAQNVMHLTEDDSLQPETDVDAAETDCGDLFTESE